MNIIKRLRRRLSSQRKPLEFFDDDVFLVSYPKSGNTWLRFLIGNYLSGGRCDFKNSHLYVPDIHYNPASIRVCTRPRFIKSHHPMPQPYKKVIYLVRDGRDVAVSYFFHLKKYGQLSKETTFNEYLPMFISGGAGDFGTWGSHVEGWIGAGCDKFMLLRYEDLKNSPAKALRELLIFSGYEVDEQKIKNSIEASTLTKMQELERHQFDEIDLLSQSNREMLFVRKGGVGDWVNYFSESMCKEFVSEFGNAMSLMGYVDGCSKVKNDT